MKITEILRARQVLTTVFDVKMSSKLAYKITKFMRETETEETFYKDKLQNIMEQYGERNDKGDFVTVENGIKIIEDKLGDCHNAVIELETTDVDNPNIKFAIDELSEIKLSPEAINILFPFIAEE